jgi:hypothetical protein
MYRIIYVVSLLLSFCEFVWSQDVCPSSSYEFIDFDCPPGFFNIQGSSKCYGLISGSFSFFEGESFCNSLGNKGHLATVESSIEQSHLSTVCYPQNRGAVWFGLNDIEEEAYGNITIGWNWTATGTSVEWIRTLGQFAGSSWYDPMQPVSIYRNQNSCYCELFSSLIIVLVSLIIFSEQPAHPVWRC